MIARTLAPLRSLMTNHVHILAISNDSEGISRMLQYVGRWTVITRYSKISSDKI